MAKHIESKVIGQLEQDETSSDWWVSSDVKIPFFDNEEFQITFMDFEPKKDKTFIEEADKALTNFFKLAGKDRNAISELVYKNCMDFLDSTELEEGDEEFRQITDKNEIWNFVNPTEIYVTRRDRRDKDIYVQVACECDWEEEHGLQLVFRQGRKLTRISDQDGHLTEADAYDIPDSKDKLLSQFDE